MLGGGRTPSREELHLEDVKFVCFSGEVAHKRHLCGRDSSSEHPGSRAHHLSGFGNKGKRRTKLGAFLPGSFGKSREELTLYTGSIILYFLLYLML